MSGFDQELSERMIRQQIEHAQVMEDKWRALEEYVKQDPPLPVDSPVIAPG